MYTVKIHNTGANFGVGTVVAEFPYAKNIGYADYINDVPEAFFTLSQNDPKMYLLRNHQGMKHVLIYRNRRLGSTGQMDLVWAGLLGEHDANEQDVVFYAYGYVSELSRLLSDWATTYTNAQINTIVSDAWTRAKTTLTSSRLAWVTTGTIEAPVTTTGGGTPVVLPSYEMYYKNTLQLFREMSALGVGDTANIVKFEITPTGTFNFWKNYGQARNVFWTWPSGILKGFRESYVPIYTFNDILAVGVNPNSLTLRDNESDATSITNLGRRQTPAFFSWVRDSTELDRATKRRLKIGLREDRQYMVSFMADSLVPPYANGNDWTIGDRVNIKITHGITNIGTKTQMVSGYQVIWSQGREHIRALIQERPGT